jgi:hypothetical protein
MPCHRMGGNAADIIQEAGGLFVAARPDQEV